MTLLEQTAKAMQEFLNATKEMTQGVIADPMLVAGMQAELIELRWKVGEEFANAFADKEKAYISRKLALSVRYGINRLDNLSIKDSETKAIEDSIDEYHKQADKEKSFLNYKTLIASLDNAIAHGHAVIKLTNT